MGPGSDQNFERLVGTRPEARLKYANRWHGWTDGRTGFCRFFIDCCSIRFDSFLHPGCRYRSFCSLNQRSTHRFQQKLQKLVSFAQHKFLKSSYNCRKDTDRYMLLYVSNVVFFIFLSPLFLLLPFQHLSEYCPHATTSCGAVSLGIFFLTCLDQIFITLLRRWVRIQKA